MKPIWYLISICFATALGSAAVRAAESSRFLEQDQLQFGMELSEAQKRVADEKDWEIAYRIDTPSTNDIACRYKEDVMYLAQFYQGRCYSLEKRAVITKDEALKAFEHYTEVLGPTPEITNSRDEKLLFGRWTLKDREIELTAYEHHTGEYMAIYTEFDPLVKGEAAYARDSELQSQPTTIDPITGKPMPIPAEQAAEGPAGEAETTAEDGAAGAEPAEEGGDNSQEQPEPRQKERLSTTGKPL